MAVVVCKVGCMLVEQCHMVQVDKSPRYHIHISAHRNSLANTADIYLDDTAPHTCEFHMQVYLQTNDNRLFISTDSKHIITVSTEYTSNV